jgi:hypothetical protein
VDEEESESLQFEYQTNPPSTEAREEGRYPLDRDPVGMYDSLVGCPFVPCQIRIEVVHIIYTREHQIVSSIRLVPNSLFRAEQHVPSLKKEVEIYASQKEYGHISWLLLVFRCMSTDCVNYAKRQTKMGDCLFHVYSCPELVCFPQPKGGQGQQQSEHWNSHDTRHKSLRCSKHKHVLTSTQHHAQYSGTTWKRG